MIIGWYSAAVLPYNIHAADTKSLTNVNSHTSSRRRPRDENPTDDQPDVRRLVDWTAKRYPPALFLPVYFAHSLTARWRPASVPR